MIEFLQAIVGFIKALAKTLNIVDIQCTVMSVIQPYLKTQVIQLDKEVSEIHLMIIE